MQVLSTIFSEKLNCLRAARIVESYMEETTKRISRGSAKEKLQPNILDRKGGNKPEC